MDKEEAVKKYTDNQIIRYLSICDNADEEKLALDYFSNKDLFPDQISYLFVFTHYIFRVSNQHQLVQTASKLN